MKKLLFLICFATLTISVNGQDEDTANSMSVLVNDKEYIAKPHRIRIGNYGYVTGNTISPDKSLRIWLGSWDGTNLNEPGTYLILGENEDYQKNDKVEQTYLSGQYKGIAFIKYVEETKSPRMEYHVGESKFTGETVVVTVGDGYQDFSFDVTLEGSIWKEKSTATAFGGLNRLSQKLEDKAVTGATGFEQNIDPEGAGYKKQKELDTITLKNGKVRIKIGE